ncbi:MAG: hypothetical protein ACJAQX_001498 [Polaribacter sp.]|jgi:hypothetical protein
MILKKEYMRFILLTNSLKRFICISIIFFSFVVSAQIVNYKLPTITTKITFSEAFIQGQGSASNCSAWTTFQSQLLATNPYSKLTIKGSLDPVGVSVTDPAKVLQLANALRTGASISITDGGRTWRTGNCGGGIELTASGSICQCPNSYTVRPCIGATNQNWGGAGTNTCGGPSQTLIVEFEATAVASSNANLSALSISAGTLSPIFASGTISYTASVSNATTSITVSPTKADANAIIQVQVNDGGFTTIATTSDSLALEEGTNTVDVNVTAQDGSTFKTYTITVTRGSVPTMSSFNDQAKYYFDGSYIIVAPISNSSGLLSYTSSNAAVATISGTTVTIVGAGSATITATQAGDATYNSGSITHVLTVTAVSVLSKSGGISATNPSYVNKNGAVNTSFGLSATGAVIAVKSPPPPAIGDFRDGGVVFWVDPADNTHGLVCAIEDQSGGIRWYNGSLIKTGATGTAIGTGSTNTTAIIANQGPVATSYAAGLARDYDGGGYTDWFLPSKDELNEMYLNKATINSTAAANSGSNFATAVYWSSTEIGSGGASVQYFGNGFQSNSNKKSTVSIVRAVRAF